MAEAVRERLPEFAILKALGYSDGRLAQLVLLEAALPTVLAALIGSVVAQGVVLVLKQFALKGAVDIPVLHASWVPPALALAAALLITLLSAAAPLQRIRRAHVATVLAAR
jgi:putative ABC transport system permease protein